MHAYGLGGAGLSCAWVLQVLELEPKNSTMLMQRAVLYESMEKYKKGVDDLREVLKLDPSNRPAMNMLNRLNKMV